MRFLRLEVLAVRGLSIDEDRKRLRHLLGYYLLLGLEFLIAADIIDTPMKPTPQDLLVLGATDGRQFFTQRRIARGSKDQRWMSGALPAQYTPEDNHVRRNESVD
jgi:hypothetical protein